MLLISADLDELIGLSDTLKVILRGVWSADFDPRTVTPQQLGSAMTGADAPRPRGRRGMSRIQRIALLLGAPVLALVVAGLVTTLVLLLAGDDVGAFWDDDLRRARESRNVVNILNSARCSTSPAWPPRSASG